MHMYDVFTDPEMIAADFRIIRKTWTQEDGVPMLTDLEEISALGIIHPAQPDSLALFPEEERHGPVYLIHSTEPLSLGESRGDTWVAPDEILWEDQTFRVIQVRDWQAYGFWKAWAIRI